LEAKREECRRTSGTRIFARQYVLFRTPIDRKQFSNLHR
jgi:hypothetical protein